MATTANLSLVYLSESQSGKITSINAAFDQLDTLVFRKTGDALARPAASSGTPGAMLAITAPSDTGLTAGAEAIDVNWTFTGTRQFTGPTTIATQRNVLILGGMTLSGTSAMTISAAATLHVFGAPVAGTNVALINSVTLWVQGPVAFGNNIQGTSKAGFSFAQGQTVAQPTAIFVQPVASATLTAGTEANIINLALNRTVTWATGALATQREFLIQAPTYAFAGASIVTDCATVAITGAPAAGANATLVNPAALWVQAGGIRSQGHLNFAGGTAPTAAAGANNGTSPPAPVVAASANDTRGTLTFGSGTGPAAGSQVVVTFNAAYGAAPVVLVSSNNAFTEALGPCITATSTTQFTIGSQNAPAASQGNTTYGVAYWVVQ